MSYGRLPDYPVRGAPVPASWGRQVVDALRARTVQTGPGLLVTHSDSATIVSLDQRPRRAGSAAPLPWQCELVTIPAEDGGEESRKVRVHPGPREVVGGHAEWKTPPLEAPYWDLDFNPSWIRWTVIYRYRHPRPDWEHGGIIAGSWGGLVGEGEEQEHVDAPEVVEGWPGPATAYQPYIHDDTEYRRFVLAVFGGVSLRQYHTGVLSVMPILDRAACLQPPEEPT